MLKVNDNPSALPPGVQSVCDLTGEWFVVQTKARAEKALAWAMQTTSAAYFLPMVRRVTFSGGRKRTGLYPLFNGYVFANAAENTWRFGLASKHIARIIPVNEQERLIAELHGLERALSAESCAVLYPHVVRGESYRVKSGPLAGITGVVVDFEGAAHVLLSISVLNQVAALPVDLSLLERVDVK